MLSERTASKHAIKYPGVDGFDNGRHLAALLTTARNKWAPGDEYALHSNAMIAMGEAAAEWTVLTEAMRSGDSDLAWGAALALREHLETAFLDAAHANRLHNSGRRVVVDGGADLRYDIHITGLGKAANPFLALQQFLPVEASEWDRDKARGWPVP